MEQLYLIIEQERLEVIKSKLRILEIANDRSGNLEDLKTNFQELVKLVL